MVPGEQLSTTSHSVKAASHVGPRVTLIDQSLGSVIYDHASLMYDNETNLRQQTNLKRVIYGGACSLYPRHYGMLRNDLNLQSGA